MYAMRLRGFSIGCQPMKNFIKRIDDPTGQYHDIICYCEKLSDTDLVEYELDYLGQE